MTDKLSGVILTSRDFKLQNGNVYVTKNNGNPGMLLIWWVACGHCHHFIPTFNEIADTIGSDFVCMSIESESITPDLSSALGVQGYPSIRFFSQDGKIIGEYNKERKKDTILKEICQVYHHCYERH